MRSGNYPAKLLLFGEYTVLTGSQALAVPVSNWSGYWTDSLNEKALFENENSKFIEWLCEQAIISNEIKDQITNDFRDGWKYISNIPVGFGLGSSGAWVAALYDRYVNPKSETDTELISMLAKMESWFHGTSSGLDPLISYLARPVLKMENGNFVPVNANPVEECYVYVWDSGIPRKTSPLVAHFKKQMNDPEYKAQINNYLLPLVEHAIHHYISNDAGALFINIEQISNFQRTHFVDFIPPEAREKWDEILSGGTGYMKLCGAGGGGEFLVFLNKRSNDPSLLEISFHQNGGKNEK